MLMDNTSYAWNTMDALSYGFSNYELTYIDTDWEYTVLENEIDSYNPNLILIPFGHWVDMYGGEGYQVLQEYVESGGGVLFTGYNFGEYAGLFDDSYAYTDWCCGYFESSSAV